MNWEPDPKREPEFETYSPPKKQALILLQMNWTTEGWELVQLWHASEVSCVITAVLPPNVEHFSSVESDSLALLKCSTRMQPTAEESQT